MSIADYYWVIITLVSLVLNNLLIFRNRREYPENRINPFVLIHWGILVLLFVHVLPAHVLHIK